MSGDVVISSTTNSAQEVESALAHDEATHYGESERSSGSLTVVSTTDDATAVSEAASMHGGELVEPEGKEFFTPIVQVDGVASTTDDAKTVREVAEDLRQEIEERPDYLTGRRSTNKRIAELVKQRGTLEDENTRLRQQLAAENTRLREQLKEPAASPETQSSEQPQNDQGQQNNQTEQPQTQQLSVEQQQQLRRAQEYELKKAEAEVKAPLRYELAKTKYPNLDAELAQCPQLPLPIIDVLKMSDDGYDVAVFLARNPAYAHAIRDSFQAGDAARAGGILDMVSNGLKFQTAQNQQQQPQQPRPQNHDREPRPAAPRPLRHISGGISSSAGDPNEMDMKSYNRWRDQGGGR